MTRTHRILTSALIAALAAASALAAPPKAAATDPGELHAGVRGGGGGEHQHVWVAKSDKKWVDPVKRKELVGYDADGKPIYKEVIVQPGYWKTITFYVCSVCGKKKS